MSAYWQRLHERVAAWRLRHPDEYAELERQAKAECGPVALRYTAGQQIVLDAMVTEKIRAAQNWPTHDAWQQEQAHPSLTE